MPPEKFRETTETIKARFGDDTDGMARHLAKILNEQHDTREDKRLAEEARDAALAKLPAEGSVVLTPEQAPVWQAFQALGLAPDAITQQIKDGQTAIQERDTLKRDEQIRGAAGAAGYDFEVLKERLGDLVPEVREVDQDGTKRPMAYVKDGSGDVLLTEYAKQHWPKYLPALAASTTLQTGIVLPAQQGGGERSSDPVDTYLKQANEERTARPNPLAPRTT